MERPLILYAVGIKIDGDYTEAVKFFHLAAKAGNESGAGNLDRAFSDPSPTNKIEYELYYLALPKDEERSRRYKAIWLILANYSYAHPSVPELDDIVPLPPAKLPPWDGKIKWLEDFKANVPPPKPSEELVAKLAHAQGLDPATGLPAAQAKALAAITPPSADALPLGSECQSGMPCPQAGLWQVQWPRFTREIHEVYQRIRIPPEHERRFAKNETMPLVTAHHSRPNWLGKVLFDNPYQFKKYDAKLTAVTWKLIAYA